MHSLLQSTKQILSDLIAFPVMGGQPNLDLANYISYKLEQVGVQVVKWKNDSGDKHGILARIGPAVDGGIILSGHMDVVPVDGQPWTVPAFKLTEQDTRWYGRGTCDMKGFLACCIASVPVFLHTSLKKPIYIAISTDEEIGCIFGRVLADHVKKVFSEKPAYAIIGEASGMRTVTGHKGICVAETIVNGSAGHSSRILSEVSAVHVASGLVKWFEDKMQQLIRKGRINDFFSPNHSSMHVGMINGGIAPNVIADSCTLRWDVRVIPGDDTMGLINDFMEYCSEIESQYRIRYPGFKIETRLLHPPVPPLITNQDAEIVKILNQINGTSGTSSVAYAAEAGQFSEAGYESVICGPGDIAQAHRANEFVEISQIEKCLTMMSGLANYLSQ